MGAQTAGLRARGAWPQKGALPAVQASHNPEADNGVKLVEASGGMLQVRLCLLTLKLAGNLQLTQPAGNDADRI